MSHGDGFWPPFKPVDDKRGYLPLEDHGLIGDGATAALVGLDGAISWMCLPRFDSPPVFCSILDRERGGRFVVAPDGLVEARQRYEPDSGVLATEMRASTGLVRVTDALTLRRGADLTEDASAARGELLRSAVVLEGEVRLRISVQPRGGASASRRGDGLQMRCDGRPDLDLQLAATQPLDGLDTVVTLREGQQLHVVLRCGWARHRGQEWRPPEVMQATLDSWRAWTGHFSYAGPHEPLVRRSAITLKLLDHFDSGAIVAAATSSLPETIGGSRNWDYRYTWVRDAAFSVYARSTPPAECSWATTRRPSVTWASSPAASTSVASSRGEMSDLVILGAGGDLTSRYLVPALVELDAAGALADDVTITGVDRQPWDDDAFRQHLDRRLGGRALPLLSRIRYHAGDVIDPATLSAALRHPGAPAVVYLALPPHVFPGAVTALGALPLAPGSRVVVEKPFGDDLDSARRLNVLVHEVVPEENVFRVDHFLPP